MKVACCTQEKPKPKVGDVVLGSSKQTGVARKTGLFLASASAPPSDREVKLYIHLESGIWFYSYDVAVEHIVPDAQVVCGERA